MTNQEAKFILGAYRPDGRDAGDPAFAAALAQAERDPELRAWFETQRKFDTAVSARLQAIAPPSGLREAILAGSHLSAAPSQRRGWKNPIWLAAAAALVLAAALSITLPPRRGSAPPGGAELAAFALRDLADAHDDHVGYPPELAGVQAQLANARAPLAATLVLDLDELRRKNCRSVDFAGRQLFELCFQQDGTWYHVYVGRRGDFAPGTFDPKALMNVRGNFASTVWSDANHVYALVTRRGAEALRRVI